MGEKPIIVGIDPGTTAAYAVLDIEGNLIKADSSKEFNLNSLIHDITMIGNVVLVGTDKAKVPNLIEAFSVKTGVKVVKPKEDLKVAEKNLLVKDYNLRNDHEKDALAASLMIYKEYQSLLDKIKNYVRKNDKKKIQNKIVMLVIKKGLSIRNAVDLIEKPLKEEVKVIKKVVIDNTLKQSDFIRLYDKLKRAEKEIGFLKKQNKNLKKLTKEVNNRYSFLLNKALKTDNSSESKKIIKNKERRLLSFNKKIKSKEKDIQSMKKELNNMNKILSQLNECYLLKKLDNLGIKEFMEKNKVLQISEGDILLVEDPNVFNQKVVEMLDGLVSIIGYIKRLGRGSRKLPFIFVDLKGHVKEEVEFFSIVSKEVFKRKLKGANILERVVEEYKENRYN